MSDGRKYWDEQEIEEYELSRIKSRSLWDLPTMDNDLHEMSSLLKKFTDSELHLTRTQWRQLDYIRAILDRYL